MQPLKVSLKINILSFIPDINDKNPQIKHPEYQSLFLYSSS